MTCRTTPYLALAALLLNAVIVTAGCGSDDVGFEGTTVGGPCTTNADCDERCLTEGDFPGGTCTLACASDDDCPTGTRCTSTKGGVCLLECASASECRAGYNCKKKSNQAGGDSLVCIDDGGDD